MRGKVLLDCPHTCPDLGLFTFLLDLCFVATIREGEPDKCGLAVDEVPATVLDSTPGDAIVFDFRLWQCATYQRLVWLEQI